MRSSEIIVILKCDPANTVPKSTCYCFPLRYRNNASSVTSDESECCQSMDATEEVNIRYRRRADCHIHSCVCIHASSSPDADDHAADRGTDWVADDKAPRLSGSHGTAAVDYCNRSCILEGRIRMLHRSYARRGVLCLCK